MALALFLASQMGELGSSGCLDPELLVVAKLLCEFVLSTAKSDEFCLSPLPLALANEGELFTLVGVGDFLFADMMRAIFSSSFQCPEMCVCVRAWCLFLLT